SRYDGTHIGLEQVSTHAGYVAHVIAHVVGNYGRISRVILRDAALYFADQVSAHVSRLGVDTAAHTGEQCDGRRSQAETGQNVGISGEIVDQSTTQKSKSHNTHTHD